MSRLFLIIGSINAMLAIMLGAFGAHALKTRLSNELVNVFQTAVQYHFYHALGLLVIGLVALQIPSSALLKWSGGVMLTGMLIFSGSLYLLAVTNIRWLGAITPVGGVAFIIAWGLFTFTIYKEL